MGQSQSNSTETILLHPQYLQYTLWSLSDISIIIKRFEREQLLNDTPCFGHFVYQSVLPRLFNHLPSNKSAIYRLSPEYSELKLDPISVWCTATHTAVQQPIIQSEISTTIDTPTIDLLYILSGLILLSNSSLIDKLTYLIELYDSDSDTVLTRRELNSMIRTALQVFNIITIQQQPNNNSNNNNNNSNSSNHINLFYDELLLNLSQSSTSLSVSVPNRSLSLASQHLYSNIELIQYSIKQPMIITALCNSQCGTSDKLYYYNSVKFNPNTTTSINNNAVLTNNNNNSNPNISNGNNPLIHNNTTTSNNNKLIRFRFNPKTSIREVKNLKLLYDQLIPAVNTANNNNSNNNNNNTNNNTNSNNNNNNNNNNTAIVGLDLYQLCRGSKFHLKSDSFLLRDIITVCSEWLQQQLQLELIQQQSNSTTNNSSNNNNNTSNNNNNSNSSNSYIVSFNELLDILYNELNSSDRLLLHSWIPTPITRDNIIELQCLFDRLDIEFIGKVRLNLLLTAAEQYCQCYSTILYRVIEPLYKLRTNKLSVLVSFKEFLSILFAKIYSNQLKQIYIWANSRSITNNNNNSNNNNNNNPINNNNSNNPINTNNNTVSNNNTSGRLLSLSQQQELKSLFQTLYDQSGSGSISIKLFESNLIERGLTDREINSLLATINMQRSNSNADSADDELLTLQEFQLIYRDIWDSFINFDITALGKNDSKLLTTTESDSKNNNNNSNRPRYQSVRRRSRNI